tara:strand:- start:240 stop:962 length:723 start_codon:yes stop_codon:yes gene_type:complete
MTEKMTTKTTDDEGNTLYQAIDGSTHKTRSGAYKRSTRVKEAEEPKPEVEQVDEVPTYQDETPDEPAWAQVDWGDADAVEVVPAVLKKIKPMPANQSKKLTKKQLEAQRSVNLAVFKILYRAGDHGLTTWKRSVLRDPDAEAIRHSDNDYEWISDITNEALMEQGVSIGSVAGPGMVALAANGYWFGKPVLDTRREAQKRGIKGRILPRLTRSIEWVPILGTRLKRRRLAALEAEKEAFE